jgi:hypothetical protein
MILNLALLLLAVALSAIFNAAMDTLMFHFSQSIFNGNRPEFWDPAISWRNKYKDYPRDKRERFWGSTTFFVWLTDGWHLMKEGMLAFQGLAFMLFLYMAMPSKLHHWYQFAWIYILFRVYWAVNFHWFFTKIFVHERSV